MEKKALLALSAATLTGLGALTVTENYQQWQRSELARLESGSQLIETALGPTEFASSGSGPTILILHGSPGGYDQALNLGPALGLTNFSILAPSRPGYLRTPLSSGRSPEAQADLCAALLDALHIETAIVLGISGGGPSALQFALRHPEHCRALITLCAVTQRYNESEVYAQLALHQRLLNQLTDAALLSNACIYILQGLTDLVSTSEHPETKDMLKSFSLPSLRRPGYDNDMQQFASMDIYPVEQLAMPTFIAQGTADTSVPFAQAQWLASKVPQARFVAVEGAGHMFFATHKDQVVPQLHSFLHAL
ncbi:alpha/beta hydrolase [Ktedonosporobacter rubrisoli]|uniref:Alpha/beta hydrolase n=1 Tax=Ktedonosporobacter rubrisoli TaxID=2509675 RepID=A0A4P6JUK6_KTERU|nr:alpha/beta hydrolase [Ktedonosporobacter rubrisoli]QBD78990.1 alpha/beta hydrolase [Ktedonosporobacter rubrisoli]